MDGLGTSALALMVRSSPSRTSLVRSWRRECSSREDECDSVPFDAFRYSSSLLRSSVVMHDIRYIYINIAEDGIKWI